METIFIIYWIATTIYGAMWLVKNPSSKFASDDHGEYFTLLEFIAKLFPAMLIAWAVMPMMLLNKIKFKRKYDPFETTSEQAGRHFIVAVLIVAIILLTILIYI